MDPLVLAKQQSLSVPMNETVPGNLQSKAAYLGSSKESQNKTEGSRKSNADTSKAAHMAQPEADLKPLPHNCLWSLQRSQMLLLKLYLLQINMGNLPPSSLKRRSIDTVLLTKIISFQWISRKKNKSCLLWTSIFPGMSSPQKIILLLYFHVTLKTNIWWIWSGWLHISKQGEGASGKGDSSVALS